MKKIRFSDDFGGIRFIRLILEAQFGDHRLLKRSNMTLREKCPNTELFLVSIFLYSVRIQENTDQK